MDNLFGLSVEQMLGKPTIHLPINMIVQEADAKTGKFWGVWQCEHPNAQRLTFGSDNTHQLIFGDCFVRPKLVLESNEFRGRGIASIATDAFMETDKWQPIFHR